MTKSTPHSLHKRGLQIIEDNLQPGDEVHFGPMFGLVFRSELEARIFKPKKHSEDTPHEMCEPSRQNDMEKT